MKIFVVMFSYEDNRRNFPKEIKEAKNNVFLRGSCFHTCFSSFVI